MIQGHLEILCKEYLAWGQKVVSKMCTQVTS